MKDLDTLCKMYESARQFMAFHGNPQQWGQTYPKRTLTESDIASGCSYVCEDQGRIIATFYYREGPDDTYLGSTQSPTALSTGSPRTGL